MIFSITLDNESEEKRMQPLGKSIRIFLMDGEPEGRWQAEFMTRIVRAYKIPRIMIQHSSDIEDLHTPAVYFLFGKDEDDRNRVYIGETEDPTERFKDHIRKKEWWTEAIILVASNGFLNKAHVKYLESQLIGIASVAKRYTVEQGRESKEPKLPNADIAELTGFIEDARLLLPTLGHNFLEPFVKMVAPKVVLTKAIDENDLLYFRKDLAIGKQTSEGFVVMKGAKIKNYIAPSASVTIKNVREKYASLVIDGILTEDILFGSSSTAAGFITGTSVNGRNEWKNESGISLKAIEEGASS